MTARDRNRDPYVVLGVDPHASEREVRAAYHRLVKLHHPDHNGGSIESARRFEEVQAAYADVRELRSRATAGRASRGSEAPGSRASRRSEAPGSRASRGSGAPGSRASRGSEAPGSRAPRPGPAPADPHIEARLAEMERELKAAHLARERAREAARKAAREAATPTSRRPTDEELGYIRTDDSFSKILADAGDELSERLGEAREEFSERATEAAGSPRAKRLADLIDELTAKLSGESPPPRAKQ